MYAGNAVNALAGIPTLQMMNDRGYRAVFAAAQVSVA
jgi:hypothetical protein